VSLVAQEYVLRSPTDTGRIVQLGRKHLKDGPYKMERCVKRIRILLGEVLIVDTTQAVYVWEHPYYPQ
jgi:hypothetical protein